MPTSPSSRSGDPAKRAAVKKVAASKRSQTNGTQAAPALTIDATPKKKVVVSLVGVTYTVAPPKASLAISITQQARDQETADAAFDRLDDWIAAAFGAKNAAAIHKRMEDPADDLDLEHIMQLMNRLLEVESGNPTT